MEPRSPQQPSWRPLAAASLEWRRTTAAGVNRIRPNWFLALPLPEGCGWHEAAAGAPPGLRRFAPADLHLTVAFLGPCGEGTALQAWRALEGLGSPPMRIAAGGWRALGPPHQPSAYGLTLAEGHAALVELLTHWGGQALQAAALPPPSRSPLPHVTLLRPCRREALQWRGPMQDWMASAPLPSQLLTLAELGLWTWSRDRSQRLFELVRCRQLR